LFLEREPFVCDIEELAAVEQIEGIQSAQCCYGACGFASSCDYDFDACMAVVRLRKGDIASLESSMLEYWYCPILKGFRFAGELGHS
jgi:hypothetical protein